MQVHYGIVRSIVMSYKIKPNLKGPSYSDEFTFRSCRNLPVHLFENLSVGRLSNIINLKNCLCREIAVCILVTTPREVISTITQKFKILKTPQTWIPTRCQGIAVCIFVALDSLLQDAVQISITPTRNLNERQKVLSYFQRPIRPKICL